MAFYNPAQGDVHVSAALTNYAQHWMQAQAMFVSLVACPNFPVNFQSDKYHVWNRFDMFADDMQTRADATESSGGGYGISQDPYFAEVAARHTDLGDQTRRNADPAANPEKGATAYSTQKALIYQDRLFVNNYMATGKWSTDLTGVASSPSASQFVVWSDANSTPVKDVDTGKEKIASQSGMLADSMVITFDTFVALRSHPDIKARLGTGSGATASDPGKQASLQDLANILDLNAVYLAGSVVANGTTVDFRKKNAALLYHKGDGDADGFMPKAMTKFSWTGYMGATPNGLRIKSFYIPALSATRYEAEVACDFKLTSDVLGYYFDKTVTP